MKKLLIILGFVALSGMLGLGIYHHHLACERANWKSIELPRLAGLSTANPGIRTELDALREDINKADQPNWIGGQVILMKNGQYLIYANRHGANEGWPHHLFLAHGSDGRWYYSSNHFCRDLGMISQDTPPNSITEFAACYGVREFDGVSDECLKTTTWPPRK